MNRWKIFSVAILFLVIKNCVVAQLQNRNKESVTSPFNATSIVSSITYSPLHTKTTHKNLQDQPVPYPSASRDFKRLGLNTGLFFTSAAIAFTALYALPESYSNWDKVTMKENGISWKWKQNIQNGPIVDQDDLFFNYVTHPWAGGIYYITARSSGFRWYESFGYSVVMSSLFWEYGIEAFAEVPSTQDLITTPIFGLVIGEGFYHAKKAIMKKHRRILKSKVLGITALFLMDPYNTVLDGLGYEQKLKTTLTFTPIDANYYSREPMLGLNIVYNF